jgi:hypothetical protein
MERLDIYTDGTIQNIKINLSRLSPSRKPMENGNKGYVATYV